MVKSYQNITFYDLNSDYVWNNHKNYTAAISYAYTNVHVFPGIDNEHLCTFLALLEKANIPKIIKYYCVRTLICPPIGYENVVKHIYSKIGDSEKKKLFQNPMQEFKSIIQKSFNIAVTGDDPELYGISELEIDKYRRILPSERIRELFDSNNVDLNYFAELSNACWKTMSESSTFLDENIDNKNLNAPTKILEEKK